MSETANGNLEVDPDVDSLEQRAERIATGSPNVDAPDESEPEAYMLTEGEIITETLEVEVEPLRENEFVCTRCYLAFRVSAREETNPDVCRDCV